MKKEMLCLFLIVILSLGLLPASAMADAAETGAYTTANDVTVCTVIFNANGGSGSMTALRKEFGTTVTLPKNTFTRSGFTFVCWNTRKDGSGTSYKNGASITVKDDTVLYAQWKRTVSITGKDITVHKGKKLVLTAAVKLGGKPAEGKTVLFRFNGKIYKKKTNSKGVAKVTLKTTKLKVGTYKFTASYGGKKITRKARIIGRIVITAKNVKVKKGKTLKLTATVKHEGKPYKNKSVTFKFKGKTYTVKTNAKGIALLRINTKSLKPGKYVYSVTCEGKTIKRTAIVTK